MSPKAHTENLYAKAMNELAGLPRYIHPHCQPSGDWGGYAGQVRGLAIIGWWQMDSLLCVNTCSVRTRSAQRQLSTKADVEATPSRVA